MSSSDEIKDIKGVGKKTAENLNEAGYSDVIDIATTSAKTLQERTDLGEKKANNIIDAARNMAQGGDFVDGDEVAEKQSKAQPVTTSSEKLDGLLQGGIPSGFTTQLYGEFSSGKCVTGDTEVIYRDNEGEVRKEEISNIFDRYGAEEGQTKVENLETMTLTEERIAFKPVSNLWKEKVEETVCIKTEKGREIEATKKHPALISTEKGLEYKKLGEISEGDVLATPASLRNGKGEMSEETAYFLGLFTAEGGTNPFAINTGDEELIEWVSGFCQDYFGFEPTVNKESNSENRRMLLRESVEEIIGERLYKKSVEKRVPEDIFRQDAQTIASYLAGYLDGDGSVNRATTFTTASEKLFEDLSYLFAMTGYRTKLRKREIEGGEYYEGTISQTVDSEDIPSRKDRTYASSKDREHVAPRELTETLRNFYRDYMSQGPGTSNAELPEYGKEVFTQNTETGLSRSSLEKAATWLDSVDENLQNVVEEHIDSSEKLEQVRKVSPFATTEVAEKCDLTESAISNYCYSGPPKSTEKRKELNKGFKKKAAEYKRRVKGARNLVEFARIGGFDKVTSVEKIEETKYVYDFVVPSHHNFVAGNMPTVMHNTQLCHQLAVNVQLPEEEGGLGKGAIYIDSEYTFMAERIEQMAEAQGLDPDEALENIKYTSVSTVDEQKQRIEQAKNYIGEDYGLIIVDSLTAHFRTEFQGRSEFSDRSSAMGDQLAELSKIARNYEIPVVYTNQTYASPDGNPYTDPTEAYGGNTLAHNSTFILYLQDRQSKGWAARLVDSPYLPADEVYFDIQSAGIRDIE